MSISERCKVASPSTVQKAIFCQRKLSIPLSVSSNNTGNCKSTFNNDEMPTLIAINGSLIKPILRSIQTMSCDHNIYHLWSPTLASAVNISVQSLQAELASIIDTNEKMALFPKAKIFIVAMKLSAGIIIPTGSCYLMLNKKIKSFSRYGDFQLDIYQSRLHMFEVDPAMLKNQIRNGTTLVFSRSYLNILNNYSKKTLAEASKLNPIITNDSPKITEQVKSQSSSNSNSVRDPIISADRSFKIANESISKPRKNAPTISDLVTTSHQGFTFASHSQVESNQKIDSNAENIAATSKVIPKLKSKPKPKPKLKSKDKSKSNSSTSITPASRRSSSQDQAPMWSSSYSTSVSNVFTDTVANNKKNKVLILPKAKANKNIPPKQPKTYQPPPQRTLSPEELNKKLMEFVAKDKRSSATIDTYLPKLLSLGNTVLRIDNLPAKINISALNLMMGTFGITVDRVVASQVGYAPNTRKPIMSIRVVLEDKSDDIARIIDKNGRLTYYNTSLLIKRTNVADLETFLKHHNARIFTLEDSKGLPLNGISYATNRSSNQSVESLSN